MYVADNSHIKRIETSLGTGDGYSRAMAQLGYARWNGKHLVIFGYGKGLSIYRHNYGAQVEAFDENSPRSEVERAVKSTYAVVTATGVKDALESYSIELIESKALLANMGVEDEFSSKVRLDRVLAAKMPLNFILEEPTHLRYVETTMALHNQGAVGLLSLKNYKGLVLPTECIENSFLQIAKQAGKVDVQILFDLDSVSKSDD